MGCGIIAEWPPRSLGPSRGLRCLGQPSVLKLRKLERTGTKINHLAMTFNLDIYRSANILVKRHGQDASIHAAMRADALLEHGYLDGYPVHRKSN